METKKAPRWSRWRLAALCCGAGLLLRACGPAAAPRSVEGVTRLLGEAVEGKVRPGEFVWEEPEGAVVELFRGRRVLFLAAPKEGGPRDLYRARMRLSWEGYPLEVRDVHNLTESPLGDESALASDGPYAGRHAAYVSAAYGSISGVTLLDLQGDGGVVGARNFLERWQGSVSNWISSGTLRGIGRTSFSFDNPVPSIKLGFSRDTLVLQTPENPPAVFSLSAGAFQGKAEELGVSAQPQPHLRKASIHWAVDTVRGVVGPGPIAWMEETFFGARDALRRTNYQMTGQAKAVASVSDIPPSPPLDASAAGDDGGYWPPSRLPSIWQQPEPQEGVWEPVSFAFLKKLPGATDPPPYFYKTWIKPDPKRPYAQVLIVALDMRQLEINMEGGVEDPMPLTGTKTFGRIPREPEILSRVVGAFNGAFKTTHGAYGMMVNRRVLLPPKPAAATVVVTDDGRVGMGAWGASERIPNNVVSFRQNLDPLVLDGQFNPTGRLQWGFQLAGHSVLTERSGICVTRPGHFLYIWGDDLSGVTLGKAMVQAGCVAGMHLDMNPKHTGFVFSDIRDVKKKDYDARLLTTQMEILPERYIEWSPKDFFYITLRNTRPAGEGIAWAADRGVQPAPAWLPGVWEAQASHGGVDVKLLGIDDGRAAFRVRVGQREQADASLQELPADEARRVIAAIGIGNGRKPRGLGFVLNGSTLSTHKGGMGYLSLDPSGALRVSHGEPPDKGDVVELPLLVLNGNLSTSAELTGPPRRRTGVCVLPSGRVVFALSSSVSDAANAMVLARIGCRTALALDRGTHEDSWLQRAGVEGAAVARSEQTTLYAVSTPMRPRAFAWKP